MRRLYPLVIVALFSVSAPVAEGLAQGPPTGGAPTLNLKKVDAEDRVQAISYCGDTYRVRTADGKTREFWERNLRFKTDSSTDGPERGAPAILPAGMMGDRASVIFAAPEEISALIRSQC
jgi:cytochrome c